MNHYLTALERAISYSGHWRWWASTSASFQVEFGAVQLRFNNSFDNPNAFDYRVALRFDEPFLVAFLTSRGAKFIQRQWQEALASDQLEPLSVDHDRFTLSSEEKLNSIFSECSAEYFIGSINLNSREVANASIFAFRAQEAGLIIRAKKMTVVTMLGEHSVEEVLDAESNWWNYWREYWRRRLTKEALPFDPLCEINIPIRG